MSNISSNPRETIKKIFMDAEQKKFAPGSGKPIPVKDIGKALELPTQDPEEVILPENLSVALMKKLSELSNVEYMQALNDGFRHRGNYGDLQHPHGAQTDYHEPLMDILKLVQENIQPLKRAPKEYPGLNPEEIEILQNRRNNAASAVYAPETKYLTIFAIAQLLGEDWKLPLGKPDAKIDDIYSPDFAKWMGLSSIKDVYDDGLDDERNRSQRTYEIKSVQSEVTIKELLPSREQIKKYYIEGGLADGEKSAEVLLRSREAKVQELIAELQPVRGHEK